jgi:metallo-beta-lactamase family protein
MLQVQFCGASGTVTGSMYLLEYTQTEGSTPFRFLVDAGSFQLQEHFYEQEQNRKLIYDPHTVDAVLVTHAHLDHVGRLAYVVKEGFKGPIYCTDTTRKLANIIMDDSARQMFNSAVKSENADYDRLIQGRLPEAANNVAEAVLYSDRDVAQTMKLITTVKIHEAIDMHPNLSVTFHDAGHILGSTWLEVTEKNTGKTVIFSGDLGNPGKPFLNSPELGVENSSIQAIFTETTYGDKLHPNINPWDELRDALKETFAKGGLALIPAFAIQRTQEVLYIISELMKKGQLPKVDVYLDSPMAQAATEVFRQQVVDYSIDAKNRTRNGDDPLNFPELSIMNNSHDSMSLNYDNQPSVIIAGSGMMNGGRILKHIRFHGANEKNSLIIVGYQAEGTIGRQIKDGEKNLFLDDHHVNLRCKVYDLHGFSGHAGQDELWKWLSSFLPQSVYREKIALKVFCVHGEPETAAAYKEFVDKKTNHNLSVIVPQFGDKVEIF